MKGGYLCHNADPYINSNNEYPYKYWKNNIYKANDRIGIELNLNNYTLTFFKNGQNLGKAFNIKYNGDIGYVFAVGY